MINVADIANQAIPLPAAAPPAETGEGDDFFDHLLREVERQEVDRQETANRESPTDETAAGKPADEEDNAIAAEATPVAPAPAAVPWPLVAEAAEVTAPELPAVADPVPVAATPGPVPQPGGESNLQPQAPATPANTAANSPPGAVTPSAATTPTPAASSTGAAASNTPAPLNAAAAATAPVVTSDANATQAEAAANVPDTGLTAPITDAAEAESILQIMGPRLTQAAATTAPAPALAMPAVAIEAAPLRILREAAPASPAGATPDSAAPVAAAAGATANAGTGKGNSGDLGFKTELGSVFAALNASEGGVTPDDFQSLVATQARNVAEAPVTGDMKAAPAGNAGTAPASAGAAAAIAQAPLNANHAEASQAASARPSAQHAAANPATMQISVQMIRAIGDGVSKISVDLNPGELGRVEVKIEVGRDGRVQGTVTADRQDTFELLQRDSRALERALQDAGLKADPQSLSFNLRGESQQGRTAPENPAARADMRETAAAEESPPPPPPSRPSNMPTGAIDIRV